MQRNADTVELQELLVERSISWPWLYKFFPPQINMEAHRGPYTAAGSLMRGSSPLECNSE